MTQKKNNINKSLIEQCKKGDNQAQFTLYSMYSRAMFNLAYRIVNNREDAEDMLQESFTDAFRNLGSFRFDSTFGAWLKRIVINKCINQVKKRKGEIITDNIPEIGHDEKTSELDLHNDIKKVVEGIAKLPDGYRLVFTLYLLEGYDHKEISTILDITESTSKSQYLRAKTRLKQILAEEKISWIN
ncbi:MAG: RNA polymerase sigma factor [Bacteroidales bacterium]|nr:RNA polymerase sigma factor [Bacteroidales bacterium]